MREPTDWEVVEHTREVLADIRQRLKAGSEGAVVTLDADECLKVLVALVDPPYPNNRPTDPNIASRDVGIFNAYVLRARTMSPPQAVGKTAELFKVTKAVVRDVIRRRMSQK